LQELTPLSGASGTGKSFTAARLLENEKEVHVFNGKEGKEAVTNPVEWYKPVKWTKLLDLRGPGVAVLGDDLMNLNKFQFETLQTLMNYNARHYEVSPVVLCCHSVLNNKIFGLVTHLTHLYLTLAKTNSQSLAAVCGAFKYPKKVRNAMVDTFLAAEGEFGYFVLDLDRMTFSRGGMQQQQVSLSKSELTPAPAEAYRKTAEAFLPLFCEEPKRAMAVFEYLLPKLPLASLNPDDLTIYLQKKTTGVEVRISLIDYLHALNSEAKPSGEVVSLHRYLARYVRLPACFVKNKYLRATQ
jgi:hypothetical protein